MMSTLNKMLSINPDCEINLVMEKSSISDSEGEKHRQSFGVTFIINLLGQSF